MSTVRHVWANV